MKPYEKYKESGVEWIGEIPADWKIGRLKNYCSLKGRIGWKGLRSDEFEKESDAYLVTGQDFQSSNINWGKCYQINKERYEEDPYIQLSNGDLLITKDGTIGKIAKVENMDKPACLNSGIFVMKQKTGNYYQQSYLYWLLVSDLLKEYNFFTSTGTTILHLYQNVFENMPFVVPPLPEQTAIANFLDYETGKIDNIISTRQRQIELLKELKSSVISHAVTKGINPNAKMKDSGVEWIGEIPEEWEVRKVKYVTKFKNGFAHEQEIDEDGEYIVVNSKFVSTESVVKKFCNKQIQPLFKNEICIVMSDVPNGRAYAKCFLVDQDDKYSLNQRVGCFYDMILNNKYFFYFMNRNKELLFYDDGINQTNLRKPDLMSVHIVYPLEEKEQQQIVAHIEERTAKIDTAVSKYQQQIDLLKEYRASLITEAVMGKIDVRDLKPQNEHKK